MKEFIVTKNDAGQRVDRFASKCAPKLPSSLLQRYFRTKDIKINGHWAKPDARLSEGDAVRLYVPDDFFEESRHSGNNDWLASLRPNLDIVYEDQNILLVNKRPGVLCHAAKGWDPTTLISQIQAHVYQEGAWAPSEENSFAPALCNRIDRGTGGIVIAAKTAEALRVIDDRIRSREIDKAYLCICLGTPQPREGHLENWLFKDAVKNQVFVKSSHEPGTSLAVTDYTVFRSGGGLSLVECRLHTGRTHQIRVQMAHSGHPLLGDGKYGIEKVNRRYGENRQLLWSYKLTFSFRSDAGALEYLNRRVFKVDHVPFAAKYFPAQS